MESCGGPHLTKAAKHRERLYRPRACNWVKVKNRQHPLFKRVANQFWIGKKKLGRALAGRAFSVRADYSGACRFLSPAASARHSERPRSAPDRCRYYSCHAGVADEAVSA